MAKSNWSILQWTVGIFDIYCSHATYGKQFVQWKRSQCRFAQSPWLPNWGWDQGKLSYLDTQPGQTVWQMSPFFKTWRCLVCVYVCAVVQSANHICDNILEAWWLRILKKRWNLTKKTWCLTYVPSHLCWYFRHDQHKFNDSVFPQKLFQ